MKQSYVLAISSYAVHGTASLKTLITLLGDKILPVPSIMLNGLTNMQLVRKFETPFAELLTGTFELAENRGLELILYIGYLGKADQADIILTLLGTYKSLIKTVIIDPVCGDHGRKYVPDEVIAQWPKLIRIADLAFPNLTELKILTGNKPDDSLTTEPYAEQFARLYPKTKLVLTSVTPTPDTIGIAVYGDEAYNYALNLLPKNYGGSGDAFLSLFILNHYYKNLTFNDALKLAADQTYQMIKNSIEKGSDDLLLAQLD
jgi:pyridoxine kinase